jgi:hypothetical protein
MKTDFLNRTALFTLAIAAALPSYAAPSNADTNPPETAPSFRIDASRITDAVRLAQADAARVVSDLRVLMDEGNIAQFAGAQLSGGRIVKSAPYCADAVNETAQILADGNRIVRKSSTRLCRDSEGRTRQETERGKRAVVYLRDPVAGESWQLDPENKTATRLLQPMTINGKSGAEMSSFGHEFSAQWREYAERMREWARGMSERARGGERDGHITMPTPPTPPAPPTPPTAPMPAILSDSERVTNKDGGAPARQVHVDVIRLDDRSALPPLAELGAQLTPLALGLTPRGPGVTTSLGSKEFDGVRANGEKTTWTIEAGKIGNEKPIVIASEKWTAPDLMLTVYTRDADPRSAETTYKLTNLKRGEPDAALFKVPADYRVIGSPSNRKSDSKADSKTAPR